MEPITASEGWGVLHLYYRVDRARAEHDEAGGKHIVDAGTSLVTHMEAHTVAGREEVVGSRVQGG